MCQWGVHYNKAVSSPISMPKRTHKDTSVSLHPLTIEEALKKAMDAGPLPKKKAEDTKPSAPPPSAEDRRNARRRKSSGG